MASKGTDKGMLSSARHVKGQDQGEIRMSKEKMDKQANENAIDVNGAVVDSSESRRRPQEIVGDRIGLLELKWNEGRTQDVIQKFYDLSWDANLHYKQELNAIMKIQRTWRGKAARIRVKKLHAHATKIQSCYRGHLHRCFALEVRRRVDKFLRLIYFGQQAVVIQRHFRGFYSRKYNHDFYKRKEYISRVVERGTELRDELWDSYLAQMEREQEEAHKNVKGEIDNFIESSHIRVGTESRKGAFYSPLIAIFGRGRSYLEEHIKDARRRQVTGMELWRKAGFDEYGIPVKVANNKFFVKQSKLPHSKMSIDTRRRVEDAAMISTTMGTYITSQNSGPYVTKWELLKKADKDKEVLIPHKENFVTCPFTHKDYQHLEHPTVRQLSEYGQDERMRKEEIKRELEEFPNMVKNPFILYHPSDRVFDLPTVKYDKVFPKRHHHTHFPQSYADRDRRLNSTIDRDDKGPDLLKQNDLEVRHPQGEQKRFQSLLTKKRLSSMKINHRRSSHVS